VILLVGLYQDRAPARMAELLESLRRNLANRQLAEVHVFLEDGLDPAAHGQLAHPKVRLVRHERRVSYADLFAYANRRPGQRCIIANSDIYFDQTLARLATHDLSGKLVCLSRWDVHPDGTSRLFEHSFSQDAWIFETPIRGFSCGWHLGLPGCDNRLAHEAAAAGLTLENPARSVRAHHLHLSGVRRYSEPQRVPGAGRGVEAAWLGRPWLWVIVPAMDRLEAVRENLAATLAQPSTTVVLVDDRPGETAGWDPEALVVSAPGPLPLTAAAAYNVGAAVTDPDAILCFLDPRQAPAPGFSEALLGRFTPDSFLVPDDEGPGSALVCGREAFDRVGGYDLNYRGMGHEGDDLRAALIRAGLAERKFPASLLAWRPGAPSARDTELQLPTAGDAVYRRLKEAIVTEVGDELARPTLRELRRAIRHQQLVREGRAGDEACAAVAFHETMGYTVARLQPGVSSHNNDARPFEEIPGPLAGLAFTQVVCSRVSPVAVEFRAAGKLYVLVGTDWDGYRPATAFLRERGQREPLPQLRTRRGTGFEVWSLMGEAGEALELPTQVMLAARELVAA
jgi:hypothetical protein